MKKTLFFLIPMCSTLALRNTRKINKRRAPRSLARSLLRRSGGDEDLLCCAVEQPTSTQNIVASEPFAVVPLPLQPRPQALL